MLKITDAGLRSMVGIENVTLELTSRPKPEELNGRVIEVFGRICVYNGNQRYEPIKRGMIIRRVHCHETSRYPSSVRSYLVSGGYILKYN